MENNKTGIVELIDRTLNKGVLLNADLIITVADVPLLAANLRLALASMETMLKYGMIEDFLGAQRLDQRKGEKEGGGEDGTMAVVAVKADSPRKYANISLPSGLVQEIDTPVKHDRWGYKNRAKLVKDACYP